MIDFDAVLLDLDIIMGDIRHKAELKRQKELEAEKLSHDIEQLRGKAMDLIQNNLELKARHGDTEKEAIRNWNKRIK